MSLLPFKDSDSKSSAVLELIHADVMGKIEVESLGGSFYVLAVLDDYSRFSEVVCLARKAEVAAALEDLIARWERTTEKKLKVLRTDNGSEFLGRLSQRLQEEGVQHQKSVRYSPQQNGRAERLNRSLIEKTRCLLAEAGLPKEFWAEAMKTANFLRNRLPSRCVPTTPYEMFYKKTPSMTSLKVFGCLGYVHVPAELRQKLDAKCEEAVFVGYEEDRKAWRFASNSHGEWQVFCSRDAKFDEEQRGYEVMTQRSKDDPEAKVNDEKVQSDEEADDIIEEVISLDVDAEEEEIEEAASEQQQQDEEFEDAPEQDPEEDPPAAPQEEPVEEIQEVRRYPARARREPQDVYRRYTNGQARKVGNSTCSWDEPQSIEEVTKRSDWSLWKAAIDSELASLKSLDVFEEAQLPKGMKALSSKWVFKIKRTATGEVEKYKARLVAKGFLQREGVDYGEVFAPTSSQVVLRCLLSFAAMNDLEIDQLDVKTAFLNGKLDEELYLRVPDGTFASSGVVWRLRKALYGLKQAAEAWYSTLSSELKKIGFHESSCDDCLFVLKHSGVYSFLLVHVDDMLVIGKRAAVDGIKKSISEVFSVADLGPISYFLGMEVVRNRAARLLWLGQSRYAKNLLQRFGMELCNPRSMPLGHRQQLETGGEALADEGEFRSVVGSIMYLATSTRPDLAHSMSVLSSYFSSPTKEHLAVSKGVLKYIRGTVSLGLMLGGAKPQLVCYSDADYGANVVSRKSLSGHAIMFGNGIVSWSSRLQSVVATSTCEAELIAATEAVKQVLWLRKLMFDLGLGWKTIPVNLDNRATVYLFHNPVAGRKRTKHIDMRYHFIRDREMLKCIEVQHVPTEDMLADCMTKQLPVQEFKRAIKNFKMQDGVSGAGKE